MMTFDQTIDYLEIGRLDMEQGIALWKALRDDPTTSLYRENWGGDWVYFAYYAPVDGDEVEVYLELQCEWFYNAYNGPPTDPSLDPGEFYPLAVVTGCRYTDYGDPIDAETEAEAFRRARPMLEGIQAVLARQPEKTPRPTRPQQLSLF